MARRYRARTPLVTPAGTSAWIRSIDHVDGQMLVWLRDGSRYSIACARSVAVNVAYAVPADAEWDWGVRRWRGANGRFVAQSVGKALHSSGLWRAAQTSPEQAEAMRRQLDMRQQLERSVAATAGGRERMTTSSLLRRWREEVDNEERRA